MQMFEEDAPSFSCFLFEEKQRREDDAKETTCSAMLCDPNIKMMRTITTPFDCVSLRWRESSKRPLENNMRSSLRLLFKITTQIELHFPFHSGGKTAKKSP